MIANRIKKAVKDPQKAVKVLSAIILKKVAHLIKDDKTYIRLKWWTSMDYPLRLDNPKTYNEKIQWLKLHDHNPKYTQMVDKIDAKNYVARIIGEDHIIPTIGVYDCVEDIDFESLPNQFVLKCTHDSNGVVICKDKSSFDIDKAKKKLKRGLGQSYYCFNREWPYKNVIPRILAEQYMEDETGELRDYKFFCFNGEVKALFIASDRTKKEETKFDFFDENFNHLPFTNGHPNAAHVISKPLGFDEMKIIATQLSQNIPHVRVDLYDIRGKIYFGELTFYHWSGFTPFVPKEWDDRFGEFIKLPKFK